jgi:hypothetical protein
MSAALAYGTTVDGSWGIISKATGRAGNSALDMFETLDSNFDVVNNCKNCMDVGVRIVDKVAEKNNVWKTIEDSLRLSSIAEFLDDT